MISVLDRLSNYILCHILFSLIPGLPVLWKLNFQTMGPRNTNPVLLFPQLPPLHEKSVGRFYNNPIKKLEAVKDINYGQFIECK